MGTIKYAFKSKRPATFLRKKGIILFFEQMWTIFLQRMTVQKSFPKTEKLENRNKCNII